MWMTEQQRQTICEPAAELGLVTLSGRPTGVALAGERRGVALCLPGGYHWTPARGDTVLVIKSGPEQTPCVTGRVEENELPPGEVYLSAAAGAGIRLKTDGSIEISGKVTVNGQEVMGQ